MSCTQGRRTKMELLTTSSLVTLCFCLSINPSFQLERRPVEYFDLGYSFNSDTVYYPGQKVEFELHKDIEKLTDQGYWYATYSFCMAEHGGTHVDAPFHFSQFGWKLDEIPDEFMINVPAAVIDIEDLVFSSTSPANFTLQVEHIIKHESIHGRIPFRGVVLLHTGWSRYWPNKVKYLGWENSTGSTATLNFPGCSEEAAKWLVNERHIVGFGIDSPSVDKGNNEGNLPVHVTFGKHNIYNIENVANLHLVLKAMKNKNPGRRSNVDDGEKLPSCNVHLFVLPIKITGATGGPARVLAYCS